MWFWFDVLNVLKKRENCLRFQFAVWILLPIFLSVFTIAALRSSS